MDDRNQWCFACGRQNPIGLKLEFTEQDGKYITTFTGGPEHQGWDNIMHGGIVSTLLDEITARYIYHQGYNAVTARLEIRYRHPTPIGQKLTITGWITGQRRNLFELAGKIELPDGTVTAEAKATVAIIKDV